MIDEQIKELRPYFHSIKELKGQAALYLVIPIKWNFANFQTDEINIKQLDGNETEILISLVSKIRVGMNTYSGMFESAKKIIKFNLEEEEKQKLLEFKMNELKSIFMNADLDKLKNLTFFENDRQNKVAGIGTGKGPEIDRGTQETDDTGDKETE